jgi:plastocyanin
MSKVMKLVIITVVVVALVGAALLIKSHKKDTTASSSSSSQSSSSSSSSSSQDTSNVGLTITYDGSSFSLSSGTVKVGQTVKVVNSSSDDLSFDSDPHPVHTDNTELNVGEVAPGKSATFTVHKVGTWGFHNHLNSSQHGSFTVVE